MRILRVLTQSRAAVTQALDWGKATKTAPSNVSRAKKTAIEMTASWLWEHCSWGGSVVVVAAAAAAVAVVVDAAGCCRPAGGAAPPPPLFPD